ncbi:MAG: general stress protein [Solirubrobacterales bacterium]
MTIASYSSYGAAERAVDWLSDQGYAVEHVAIVGKGLRSVEQVTSRMSGGRAALIGAGSRGTSCVLARAILRASLLQSGLPVPRTVRRKAPSQIRSNPHQRPANPTAAVPTPGPPSHPNPFAPTQFAPGTLVGTPPRPSRAAFHAPIGRRLDPAGVSMGGP